MRRVIGRGAAGVALAVISLLAAGCAQLPAGADGDLVDGWPAPAEPVAWTPKAQTCHAAFQNNTPLSSYAPVDCGGSHRYETVYVGEFTDAAGDGEAVSPGDGERRRAWSDCDKRTSKFLGGQWRDARLWIGLSLPSPQAWAGGARWYRCEVAVLEPAYGDPVEHTGSLAGELDGGSDLKLGCAKYSTYVEAIACSKPHNAEYVGVHFPKVAFSALPKMQTKLASACRDLVAEFVKVPKDKDLATRSGVVWTWPSEADWAAGDNAVRCYLWLEGKKVSKSLKGTGTGGLPVIG